MFRQLSISQKGLLIVVLLVSLNIVFIGFVGYALAQTRLKLAKEKEVVDLVGKISHTSNLSQKYGVALAQESAKNERDEYGEALDVHSIQQKLLVEIDNLTALLSKDEFALDYLNHENTLVQEIQSVFELQQRQHNAPQTPERVKTEGKMIAIGSKMSLYYDELLSRYKTIEDTAPQETTQSIANLKQLLLSGLVLNMVSALVLAFFFITNVTRRIAKLSLNFGKFQRGEQLPPESKSFDEIGQLDQLFHEMAANLSEAAANEKALVDGAYDVICTINASGEFAAVNKASQRQWGFDSHDLVGRHFSLVVTESDISSISSKLENLKNKNSYIDFPTKINCKDGRNIDAQWSCFWSRESQAAFCFVRDVTELNAMEAQLRAREEQTKTLMQSVPVGLCVVDKEGEIKSANYKFEVMRKGALNDDGRKSISGILEDEDVAVRGDLLERAKLSRNYRCFLKAIDGERIPTEVTVSDFESFGAAERLVVVEDISERVRLESIKHDFVVILRNKLRTMLQTLRSHVTDASSGNDERTQKGIDRILRNTDRLLKLIDELFALESFGAGRLVGELKSCSITSVLTVAVDSLADFASRQGVTLVMETCEVSILADFERLVQVVVNLISNAVKFSGPSHRVTVTAKDLTDLVEVSITDSGRGVPEELRQKIFEPYEQASESDAKKGTGLGLPICKTIVEAHSGTIGVRSNADLVGSVFWFKIPKSQAPE